MTPGPELDRIVCEAVGIQSIGKRDGGYWETFPDTRDLSHTTQVIFPKRVPIEITTYPPVSTVPTFEQFQQIMEWLKHYNRVVSLIGRIDGWSVGRTDEHGWTYESEEAPTILLAVCEAVRAVVEARKEGAK